MTTTAKPRKKNFRILVSRSTGKRIIFLTNPEPQAANLKVFFTGPFMDDYITVDNNETPYWRVFISTSEDAETKYSYILYDFEKAADLAYRISREQHLELISSATAE